MHMHIETEETQSIELQLDVIYARMEYLELQTKTPEQEVETQNLMNLAMRLESRIFELEEDGEKEIEQLAYDPLTA